ncbi:MAG: cold shock domain-containing protein [Rhodobacteraceae bacterium]|nr:cold shock domain-containing protein [Paracoccaceae bacterium]
MQKVRGKIKWFDPVKGFGFIILDEGGPDVLLHLNVLRHFGQSSIAEGTVIDVITHTTPRGTQVREVIAVKPPKRGMGLGRADPADATTRTLEQPPLRPARVKWFDKSRGFGFANVFGQSEDVFVRIESMRGSGLSDLQPGEALAIRVIDGKRGKLAAEVCPWEAALTAGQA